MSHAGSAPEWKEAPPAVESMGRGTNRYQNAAVSVWHPLYIGDLCFEMGHIYSQSLNLAAIEQVIPLTDFPYPQYG